MSSELQNTAFVTTTKDRCRVCFTCVRECPAKAIELTRFEDAPIMARLDGLFERSA